MGAQVQAKYVFIIVDQGGNVWNAVTSTLEVPVMEYDVLRVNDSNALRVTAVADIK